MHCAHATWAMISRQDVQAAIITKTSGRMSRVVPDRIFIARKAAESNSGRLASSLGQYQNLPN